jgi:peptidoglycan/LPS O-acetylase OafA/YrhL
MQGVHLLLLIFIYKPQLLTFLQVRWMTSFGVASYSTYLIHQNIGVVIIRYFRDSNFVYVIPLLLMVISLFFGYLSFNLVEKKIGKFLKKHSF